MLSNEVDCGLCVVFCASGAARHLGESRGIEYPFIVSVKNQDVSILNCDASFKHAG
jgi:hypothetical protein